MTISRELKSFFEAEIANKDGVQPATLGSALDSWLQIPDEELEEVLNLDIETDEFDDVDQELEELIDTKGEAYLLQDILT